MIISESLLNEMLTSFPPAPPEMGALLGANVSGEIVKYYLDTGLPEPGDRAAYTPDIAMLSSVLEEWSKDNITFAGIAHSHPNEQRQLSTMDKAYISRIIDANPGKPLYFPIVLPGQIVIYTNDLAEDILVHPPTFHKP